MFLNLLKDGLFTLSSLSNVKMKKTFKAYLIKISCLNKGCWASNHEFSRLLSSNTMF